MSEDVEVREPRKQRVASTIRWLSVPIVLFWLVVAAITNVLVPQLEVVGEAHNVALSSPDAPSLQAFKRIGAVFDEFDSDSAAMVVLEGDKPLGARGACLLRHSDPANLAGPQARSARPGLLG